MKKIILITGASSGIGFATLKRLISDEHTVYGTARSDIDKEKIENAGGKFLQMEMTEYETLESTIRYIVKHEGKIDVLFNNAGYGLYGTVEEVPLDVAKHQFDVNLFGLARLTQLVIPHMRSAGSGTIINTSSMGGKMYTPLGAWYHATKHALEGWSDCLRIELKQFNIDVVILEPGVIHTEWSVAATDNMLKYSGGGPYAEFAKLYTKNTRDRYSNKNQSSDPIVVANIVSKIISSRSPKTRYLVGKSARLAVLSRKYFGDRIFDRIITGKN